MEILLRQRGFQNIRNQPEESLSMKSEFKKNLQINKELIDSFAKFSGDYNPIHMCETEANKAGFEKRVMHGAGLLGLVSSLVANDMPGPGSVLLEMNSKFKNPAYDGDVVCIEMVLEKFSKLTNVAAVSYEIKNQNDKSLCKGDVKVLYEQK